MGLEAGDTLRGCCSGGWETRTPGFTVIDLRISLVSAFEPLASSHSF